MQRAMPFTLFQLPPKYDACGGLNFQILRLSSKNAFILLSSTFTLFKCNSEANHRSRSSCSMDFAVENSCITSSLFDAILWFKFPHSSSVFCVCFRISGNKLFSLYYSHLLHSVEDGMWQLQGRVCCPTRERTFCTLEVLALGRCSMPEETKVISVRFCPTKTEKNAQCLQSRLWFPSWISWALHQDDSLGLVPTSTNINTSYKDMPSCWQEESNTIRIKTFVKRYIYHYKIFM